LRKVLLRIRACQNPDNVGNRELNSIVEGYAAESRNASDRLAHKREGLRFPKALLDWNFLTRLSL